MKSSWNRGAGRGSGPTLKLHLLTNHQVFVDFCFVLFFLEYMFIGDGREGSGHLLTGVDQNINSYYLLEVGFGMF